MCRDPRLHEQLNNGDTLWAIGLWRLGKIRSEERLRELLEPGEQIQDIFVIKDDEDRRDKIKQAAY